MTDAENASLTPVTKAQKPDGVYPEAQTHTPHSDSETDGAHTHPPDSITAVQLTLSRSKDEEHLQSTAVTSEPTPPHTWSSPDDNTTSHYDLNTSWTESKETVSKDESKEKRESDEDDESVDRLLTEDKELKGEEVQMSQSNHIPLVSTSSGAATNQTPSPTLTLSANHSTEALATPTQLPPEDNKDENRENMSSEDEEITEMLQVTTSTKVTKNHTPTTTHTHTTTQHLSDDTENQDEEERSIEDNLQMSVEIQDSIAAQISTANVLTLTRRPYHLVPTHHKEVRPSITPSQVTSASSPKTAHTQRPTTHTSPFTPRTVQTYTTFTPSPHTSHTPLTKPSVTHKTAVTLPQSPGILWRKPVTHKHMSESHLRHTPKPNTSQASADKTTHKYSEEEEEEKSTEIKKELLDSSQEAESKSKSKTKICR